MFDEDDGIVLEKNIPMYMEQSFFKRLKRTKIIPESADLFTYNVGNDTFKQYFQRQKVKANTLCEVFNDLSCEDLSKVYLLLGSYIRIIYDSGFSHGDVHYENVILRENDNVPFIIDWEHLSFEDPFYDLSLLLHYTKKLTVKHNKIHYFPILKNKLLQGFGDLNKEDRNFLEKELNNI